MNSQQQMWYSAGSDLIARAGFSLAMCGALAGLLYLTAHNGTDQRSVATASPARTATILASFDSGSGVSKSQLAVDESPVSLPLQPKTAVPLERVAEVKPASTTYAVLPIKRPAREPVAAAATVAHFESCLPGCETHDPLIVGQATKVPEPGLSPSASDELVEQVRFEEPAPSILGKALQAPGIVYRTGRNALTTLVRAAL